MERLLKILNEINPDIDYETETALVEDGLFDSLEIMAIINDIEDVYKIEIDPDDIIAENFNSADAMMAVINKYI